ncbi:MAG: MATE family efflux transporter [Oscillospiraceae bacterium]|nr:MATE family efflux transporter [Oscillospiraceae bacterium]
MKKDMTRGSEWKLVLMFTLPIMAGSLLQQLYNTVDGVVVGRFVEDGKLAFAGVGICAALTFLFLAFAMGISVGVGVVVSQYFGAKKNDELAIAVDTALIMLGALGIAVSVIGYAVSPLLIDKVLTVPPTEGGAAIREYALTYIRVYCLGLVFQFIYNCISFTLRGVGDSKATLLFLLVTASLNVALDLLFVVAFHWDVAGVAWATFISQAVCMVISYIYLRRRFPFIAGGRHFDGKLCRTILRIGVPTAVQQSIVSFGNIAMQRLVNGFGEDSMAAFSAGIRINNFMFVPITGFQSGLANFTGQNIGANRLDRVKRGYRHTLLMTVSVSLAVCALLFFFARPIVSFFGLTGKPLDLGVEQVRFVAPCFIIFAVYMTLGGVLQGAGDTVLQSAATLTALAVRVVVGYVGVAVGFLGYSAAWITLPIGWVFALVITNIRYYTGGWKKKAVVGPARGAPPDAGEGAD